MPSFVYEQFEGGTVTLDYNANNGNARFVEVVNPTPDRVWRGTVYDPASRQPDGSYAVGYSLECGPGQTIRQNIPAGALRLRAYQENIGTEQEPEWLTGFEVYNTATRLWERPIPYASTLGYA